MKAVWGSFANLLNVESDWKWFRENKHFCAPVKEIAMFFISIIAAQLTRDLIGRGETNLGGTYFGRGWLNSQKITDMVTKFGSRINFGTNWS